MSDKSAVIVAQYIRHLYAQAHVRPYENKSALSNGIAGSVQFEPLPEAGHWRIELTLSVTGQNTEGVACFETGCTLEAIVYAQNLEPEEVGPVLTHNITGLLVGNIRAALSTASLSTGYGPVTLPPMTADQLSALAANSNTPS